MRELAAELERPVLLFSGGKDSIVLLRLAEKAFRPGKFPFPVMHVDTGHNFPEVIEYRDRRVAELGETLLVASVQESIDKGRVVEETGPRASRNQLQTTTLLDAIEEHRFDAAIGGARRAEEQGVQQAGGQQRGDDRGSGVPPRAGVHQLAVLLDEHRHVGDAAGDQQAHHRDAGADDAGHDAAYPQPSRVDDPPVATHARAPSGGDGSGVTVTSLGMRSPTGVIPGG